MNGRAGANTTRRRAWVRRSSGTSAPAAIFVLATSLKATRCVAFLTIRTCGATSSRLTVTLRHLVAFGDRLAAQLEVLLGDVLHRGPAGDLLALGNRRRYPLARLDDLLLALLRNLDIALGDPLRRPNPAWSPAALSDGLRGPGWLFRWNRTALYLIID